jgi:hypothetical protein
MRHHHAIWLLAGLAAVALASGCDGGPPRSIVEEPRQFSGVWIYSLKGSTFLENETAVPDGPIDRKEAAFLFYHPSSVLPGIAYDDYDEQRECYPVHAFRVTLAGQQTIHAEEPGDLLEKAGYQGLWSSEIRVERVLAAEPLPSPDCRQGRSALASSRAPAAALQ